MPKKSYRQAINEAIRQEMRRDDNVMVIGEDVTGGKGAVGEKDAWGGAFGVTKGLLAEFGATACSIRRSPRAPSSVRPRRRDDRPSPGRRVDVRRLHGRVLRPDLQSGREIPLHVRRQGGDAVVLRTIFGAGFRSGKPAQPVPVSAVHPHSGAQGGRAVFSPTMPRDC